MSWFAVDDSFWSHPKVVGLSLSAVGLWCKAGSYCAQQLTDGRINARALTMLGPSKGRSKATQELVAAGLWEPDGDGFRFLDWADYQPTRERKLAERAASRERQKKRREEMSRRDKTVTPPVTHGVTPPAPSPPLPTPPLKTTPIGVVGTDPARDIARRVVAAAWAEGYGGTFGAMPPHPGEGNRDLDRLGAWVRDTCDAQGHDPATFAAAVAEGYFAEPWVRERTRDFAHFAKHAHRYAPGSRTEERRNPEQDEAERARLLRAREEAELSRYLAHGDEHKRARAEGSLTRINAAIADLDRRRAG